MADAQSHKSHVKAQSGRKAERKAERAGKGPQKQKGNNWKAFSVQNVGKASRRFQHAADKKTKKHVAPTVDRRPDVPPPVVVAVVGPPQVGKTTLIRSLVKRYTRQTLNNIQGPITVVTGKNRRLTFVECANDMNAMLDCGKVADLILLMVDASYGFEMETFEFLNVLQTHGFPKVMGVLTHLDHFKSAKTQRRVKKELKNRFWTEIYQGAKLFYLS
eukprot:gene17004-4320_t